MRRHVGGDSPCCASCRARHRTLAGSTCPEVARPACTVQLLHPASHGPHHASCPCTPSVLLRHARRNAGLSCPPPSMLRTSRTPSPSSPLPYIRATPSPERCWPPPASTLPATLTETTTATPCCWGRADAWQPFKSRMPAAAPRTVHMREGAARPSLTFGVMACREAPSVPCGALGCRACGRAGCAVPALDQPPVA